MILFGAPSRLLNPSRRSLANSAKSKVSLIQEALHILDTESALFGSTLLGQPPPFTGFPFWNLKVSSLEISVLTPKSCHGIRSSK